MLRSSWASWWTACMMNYSSFPAWMHGSCHWYHHQKMMMSGRLLVVKINLQWQELKALSHQNSVQFLAENWGVLWRQRVMSHTYVSNTLLFYCSVLLWSFVLFFLLLPTAFFLALSFQNIFWGLVFGGHTLQQTEVVFKVYYEIVSCLPTYIPCFFCAFEIMWAVMSSRLLLGNFSEPFFIICFPHQLQIFVTSMSICWDVPSSSSISCLFAV